MASQVCDRHSCVVWFYNPAMEEVSLGSFVNKCVAALDGPFCHTELQFPDGNACSIVMHGCVRMWKRTFDPCFYTGLRVQTTEAKVKKAQEVAQTLIDAPTPFSFWATGNVHATHTYCSKLVRDILIDSEVYSPTFYSQKSSWFTPSGVYRHLLQETNVSFHRMSAKISPIDFSVTNSSGA